MDAFIGILSKNTKILELGCGSGKVIAYLCKKGAIERNITGVDISNRLLDIARKKYPEAKFIKSDISSIKIPQKSFQLILAIRTFEYLSNKELVKTLKTCFSSLKKNGVLFIIIGHPIRVNGQDVSSYQNRGLRKHTIPGGLPVNLFHKTFSDYLNTAIQSGFLIDLIDEPEVPINLAKLNPADYSRYKSYGSVILVMRLIKP